MKRILRPPYHVPEAHPATLLLVDIPAWRLIGRAPISRVMIGATIPVGVVVRAICIMRS